MDNFDNLTLGELPRRAASLWGDHEALYFQGTRTSFLQFSNEVDRYAKALIGANVLPKDRIAVWMTNRPEMLFLIYAIAKIGAISVPLNTRYRSEDAAYAIAQSRSNLLFTMDHSGPVSYEEMIAKIFAPTTESESAQNHTHKICLNNYPDLRHVTILGESSLQGVINWTEFLESGNEISDSDLESRASSVKTTDEMAILYTSGTTGNPKGAIHCHSAIQNTLERTHVYKMTQDDVHMSYLPLFHLYGFSEVAMAAIFTGSRQILMDQFDASRALNLAEQEKATLLHGFDVHWIDLLREQQKNPRSLNFRLGTYPAGTEISSLICKQVQEIFGPTVSGWGMTETWAFVTCNRPDDSEEQRTMASGSPMPGYEIRIVSPETSKDVNPGEQGILLVKGYAQMKGYFDKPDETASTINEDGWVNTGDMARLRADGHIVFLGRYKDILKVGGENVSPSEIESRLLLIQHVDEVAVVGVSDSRLGEVPVAFVKSSSSATTEKEILSRCRGKIASFKIPRYVFFVNEFPTTPSGKVKKVELREAAEELVSKLDSGCNPSESDYPNLPTLADSLLIPGLVTDER